MLKSIEGCRRERKPNFGTLQTVDLVSVREKAAGA
jgi:hypothetical protein